MGNHSLRDGSFVRVWADGYQESRDEYGFGVLVDLEADPG
jgi:hypothetical protein